jgi:dTDP-4-amino-4,6-dideoxygalactose transaminase
VSTRPAILGGAPAFPDGLPFARPAHPPLERVVERLRPSYERGRLTNGPLVRELEERVSHRLRVRHVVAVASCTSGLLLALRVLVRERGAVVLPSFTFSASAHAVAWNGLEPRFAECEAGSFQLDPGDSERRLDGAGAFLPTHVFGAPCAVERFEALARKAGIPLVFDAAHAFGALRRGQSVGGFGDAEVFSLTPTKPLVAGEGGLVATRHDDVAERLRWGRDYGHPGDYDTRFVGLNARMSELHAAVALEALVDFEAHLARRRELAARYLTHLEQIPGVSAQAVDPDDASTFKDFTVAVEPEVYGIDRDSLVAAVRAEGIETRCYFWPPVHLQEAYARSAMVDLPLTVHVARRVVSLPIYPDLSEAAVDTVADVLARVQRAAPDVGAAVAAGSRG